MEIQSFIENEKLIIPETEIDNIYIWYRVSQTREILLPVKTYYTYMKTAFEQSTDRVVKVLQEKLPAVSRDTYQFSDFVTFQMNKNKIFNNKTCFAYISNAKLLNSLACFLAHTMNKYLPICDSIGSLIINKIDEPEKFTSLMDSDFVILDVYSALPEHKYRGAILDSLLTRRSKPGLSTLIFVINKNLLIGPDLIAKERAEQRKLVDLTSLSQVFEQRRQSDYKSIMKDWISMMSFDENLFVYSKDKPENNIRTIDRYKR